ncbi:MAG: hypothetical protein E7A10_00545 [Dermabacter sp.]|nr:hypothetical protein [Dermabacter sp.]
MNDSSPLDKVKDVAQSLADTAKDKIPAGVDAAADAVVDLAAKAEEKFPQAKGVADKVVDVAGAAQDKAHELGDGGDEDSAAAQH